MFVADRPPQLLFAVCIALLLLGGACVKGQTTNGRVHLTPADSVLAAKLGVAPHVRGALLLVACGLCTQVRAAGRHMMQQYK